jgi:hypothetical protein
MNKEIVSVKSSKAVGAFFGDWVSLCVKGLDEEAHRPPHPFDIQFIRVNV